MADSFVAADPPKVHLIGMRSITIDSPISDTNGRHLMPTVNVHRSMSLQSQRRPDRNNNSNNNNSHNGIGHNNNHNNNGNAVAASNMSLHHHGGSVSHFELGNLLARAASFDAKFLRQLNECETTERRVSTSSGSNINIADSTVTSTQSQSPTVDLVDLGGLNGRLGSVVHLPERYAHAVSAAASGSGPSRRRTSIGSKRRGSAVSTAAGSNVGLLDTVPELTLRPSASLHGSDAVEEDVDGGDPWRQREFDALVAMKWLRQEIRALKQHDRVLMRRLFDLGSLIHHLNGGLYETVSCQTVTTSTPPLAVTSSEQSSSLLSALKWRPHVESDDCIQTSVLHEKTEVRPSDDPATSEVANNRAVSMIDVRPHTEDVAEEIAIRTPVKPSNSLNSMTSRASRLFTRILPRNLRSSDQIVE